MGLKGCVSTTFMEGEWLSFNCDGVALVIFSSGLGSTFSSFGVGGHPNSFSYKNDMCPHVFEENIYPNKKNPTNWII
jgi:hypothetical protein